jgi:UDP-GlcNAc:undecaprenyl-phosphate/decaprenyl-phosphate GlcNAc-1-phosphate transferase
MDLGHGHRRSVVILWGWTALLSAFVLYPTLTGRNPAYLPFGILALAIVLYTVLHPSVRARRRSNGAGPAPIDHGDEHPTPVGETVE